MDEVEGWRCIAQWESICLNAHRVKKKKILRRMSPHKLHDGLSHMSSSV